jgi:hypothetical protein
MAHADRLDFIAAGLPLIAASAQGFWEAGERLKDNPREAAVLQGFAEEEAAKALILVDLVRCPAEKVDGRVGRIVKNFYSHLARLIYAKAQTWRPVNVKQLQEYVDTDRQAHYLEGGMSEYIVPNWTIYSRENALYVDIEMHEDGVPKWNDPWLLARIDIPVHSQALRLVLALRAVGAFSRAGLQILSEIWGQVDFRSDEHSQNAEELTRQTGTRLEAHGLVTEACTDDDVSTFYHSWQMPMYNVEFGMIPVSLEELEAARDAAFWSEVGY